MAGAVIVSCGLFVFLQDNSNQTVAVNASKSDLDSWSISNSALNGAPLKENKNIYTQDDKGKITSVYITAFPTETDDGKTLNFSDFDLDTARSKEYNPVLNANVQFGNKSGGLSNLKNANQVNATIRLRGSSSRSAAIKSYKVKLKGNDDTFKGRTTLNLNKHVSDPSKITNKLCMDLMQTVDNMSSFQTDFMLVYIRDGSLPQSQQQYKYYGLYTNIEQPNKSYLKLRGLDENGSLYKAENFEFRQYPELKNVDDPNYDEAAFEKVLKIREGKDHTKLLTMLKDINDMNQDFNTVFHKYFNEDNYLTWMACNVLFGNEDTIAHNFILYNPQNSLTWYMLPWDFDGTFRIGKFVSNYNAPIPLKGIQRMTGVLLHRRYFKQPGNIEKLTAKIEELLKTSFSKDKVNALLDDYRPVLAATMSKDPDVLIGKMPPNELNTYIDQFYSQIELNYQNYRESLKYPTPVFVSEPTRKDDGSVYFSWEPSYTFDDSFAKYNIILAKDYKMQNVIFQKKNLSETNYVYNQKLPAGTYYLKVFVTNDKGLEQYSLDFYHGELQNVRIFGVRQVVIK